MAGSTSGEVFQVMNWGESHGPAIGATIDGCPAGIELTEEIIQADLDRRRPGQSDITTPRNEADEVRILSGVFEDQTTGTPIQLMIGNGDQRPHDYSTMLDAFRPSHADFTYTEKYGLRDPFGGGRSSARVTAGTVAAGAVAKLVVPDVSFTAYVKSIFDIDADIPEHVDRELVEASKVRCPDPDASEAMEALIKEMVERDDSVGGIIELIIRGLQPGLGEPVYDKLHADLGKAMLNINAVKAIEFGLGFAATRLTGSQHNDPFENRGGTIGTTTNNSAGIQGGISNGEDVVLRVAFKPTATIGKEQDTVTKEGESTKLAAKGRHDPCVVPRAVPIVEAAAALVVADHTLRQRISQS